jgi:hypothetical protein
MADTSTPRTLQLRDLPLAARLTLALFMISVGLGYLSALINLHFQSASAGQPLPTQADATGIYHGKTQVSQLERLLTASPDLPFNGQGSMRPAWSKTKVGGWPNKRKLKAAELGGLRGRDFDPKAPADVEEIDREIHRDLDGERLAVLAWIHGGLKQEAYEKNALPMTGELANVAITEKFVDRNVNPPAVMVKSILVTRCVRCHSELKAGSAAEMPLETYEQIAEYAKKEVSKGMSLPKLALTTHVHLLGFSMLYGLTGLVLAFSSYPRTLRVILCPLPLLAQIADIACWWLGRVEEPYGPMFAGAIIYTGAVVAGSLLLQIVLSLWDLFGKTGKTVVVLLLAAAAAGGYLAKDRIIDPYLKHETSTIPTSGP